MEVTLGCYGRTLVCYGRLGGGGLGRRTTAVVKVAVGMELVVDDGKNE